MLAIASVINVSIDNTDVLNSYNTHDFERNNSSDWVYSTAPGAYRLPVKHIKVILPPNAESITHTSTILSTQSLKANAPAICTPFYDGINVLSTKSQTQPSSHIVFQGIGMWGDVCYASFAIYPALYDNAAKAYTLAQQMNITINYTAKAKETTRYYNVPKLMQQDQSFLNIDAVSSYYPASSHRTYDYLVITTPELYNAAQGLITFRQNQGLITAFADINQILASSPGANPPEKLRNYLFLEYITAPFTYLLLIGDTDVVPIAYLTPEPNGINTVPSDFYYSDLNSDFDSDNDNLLGEYNSGMDYTPELIVGRIPWNSTQTVSQICARTVSFEQPNQAWKNKALLPAAMLNYADEIPNIGMERTDGATFMEYCKSNVLSNFQTTTMYEQLGLLPSINSDYVLKADTLTALLSTQSWGLVNWSAHGSAVSSARKVWLSDQNDNNLPDTNELVWANLVNTDTFNSLANQDGSVYFCASCNNGMIDNDTPSLGETLLKKKAVADISATRTGWYKLGWENPGWGGLSSYNYHFLENYAQLRMTVGQAHAYANWLHTQYCLFGDPIDDNGIIWPELQNIYTYILYGDPAIGYPAVAQAPIAKILIWEPEGNTGNTILNGLHSVAPINVVYTNHLIDTYNYLSQFDAVFCLFGLSYGPDNYNLTNDSFEYAYLLSFLQQGGKVYMEGMVNWDQNDPLFGRFGTIAPFDHIAMIEQISYTNPFMTYIWDYEGYNGGTQALATYGGTSQPLFYSYNQNYVNDIIGIWNRIGNSRTISSSFELSGVTSDVYSYWFFLSTILDTLGVLNSAPTSTNDNTVTALPITVTLSPNPFTSMVKVHVKSDLPVTISVYNIKGQLIKTTTEIPQGGNVQWLWDAKDNKNGHVANGIYLLKADNGRETKLIKTLKLH
jgi:hypothetical protein